ncbi:MAG: thiamine phosphate synthase [Clostridiales bacterium]|nr:thiamine phosphate synthase [Clostridiales bacterium]
MSEKCSLNHMIAVTNRKLCDGDFLEQIRYLASTDIEAIILREKDLTETEYERLAADVLAVCAERNKKCILHSYIGVARRLGCPAVHLPLAALLANREALADFIHIGTSVHSIEEARRAEAAGATCLIAGHIFDTDCKKGLPGRGLPFLRDVCAAVQLPVYAIGGVTQDNVEEVMTAGAVGGCMMSAAMRLGK